MKQEFNKNNKRKIATASMAILGVTLVVSGAFAALSDTLSHDETVTIEWVDIVDGSGSNLALEDVSDVTNTPVTELTPGITYELTGTLENDSTVITEWIATDVTEVVGMNVEIADSNGNTTPAAVGEDIDVAQFGITVQLDEDISPSTSVNLQIEFTSTDARGYVAPPQLSEPTAINVVFPDPALAACIASDSESGAAGNVNALITQETLNNFDDLKCIDQGITSIEGVQYMTNLTFININRNAITDITPLAYLSDLTYLDIGHSPITDFTPIASLTNLETISLYNCGVTDSDLAVLANLNNLTYANLGTNLITDVTQLAGLTSLETLYLDHNQIVNITPLSNLTNLELLSLSFNEVTDITPLAGLTNLKTLYLGANNISDLTPLSGLTNLQTLSLYENEITDITPLGNLVNLTYISLSTNYINDLSPLSNLTKLDSLYINNNKVTNFSPLTYQPTTFFGYEQNVVLPDTTLGTPTAINLDGVNGQDLIITFNTPGTYSNGQLTWDNPGVNSLSFRSTDGQISGTITQTVN